MQPGAIKRAAFGELGICQITSVPFMNSKEGWNWMELGKKAVPFRASGSDGEVGFALNRIRVAMRIKAHVVRAIPRHFCEV